MNGSSLPDLPESGSLHDALSEAERLRNTIIALRMISTSESWMTELLSSMQRSSIAAQAAASQSLSGGFQEQMSCFSAVPMQTPWLSWSGGCFAPCWSDITMQKRGKSNE